MRKIFTFFAAMLFVTSMVADPIALPGTLNVSNVSSRSEGLPNNYVIAEGAYAGTYFDMGPNGSSNDTLLYAEWDVTIEQKKYNVAVDVYNTNGWSVQLNILTQAGDTVKTKSLRYHGPKEEPGNYSIGTLDLTDLTAGNYKVRVRAATAWSAMKLKDVIFELDHKGEQVTLPGTLQPAYAELFNNASIANGAIAFKPSTANTDYATWNVSFAAADVYKIAINITASNGHNYGVALRSADGTTKIDSVGEGGQNESTGVKELGSIIVPVAGNYKIKLTNGTQHSNAVLNSITFTAPAVSVTSIALDANKLSLDVDESEYLTATVLPDNASDPSVTWTSSDNAIASVSGGMVTGVAAGTATITARAGAKTATCAVTVSANIPSTDFASPLVLVGKKAHIEGNIQKNEAYNLKYFGEKAPGIASWKVTVTQPCIVSGVANGVVEAGQFFELDLYDSENNRIDSIANPYARRWSGGNVKLDSVGHSTLTFPAAGTYTLKLRNEMANSVCEFGGLTLTKVTDLIDLYLKAGVWNGAKFGIYDQTESAYLPSFMTLVDGTEELYVTHLYPRSHTVKFVRFNTEAVSPNADDVWNVVSDLVIPADKDAFVISGWGQGQGYGEGWWSTCYPEITDNGYYYLGNRTEWLPANNTKFTLLTADPEEYTFVTDVSSGDEFKAVKITDKVAMGWYPDGSNYVVPAEKAGNVKIYFRPAGKSDWDANNGDQKFYVDRLGNATGIDNTVVGEKAVKVLRNGMLLIEKDGKTYNVLGTIVK